MNLWVDMIGFALTHEFLSSLLLLLTNFNMVEAPLLTNPNDFKLMSQNKNMQTLVLGNVQAFFVSSFLFLLL